MEIVRTFPAHAFQYSVIYNGADNDQIDDSRVLGDEE
jgi:hypothetical protein